MVEAALRDGWDIRGRGRRPKMFTPIALTQISHDGCRQFLAYWRSKRNGGAVPDRHDFDPLVEVPSLAAGFFIYDVEDEARDFRLRLMGTGLVQMFGRDVTGQLISSYWSPAELGPVLEAMRSSLSRESRSPARAPSIGRSETSSSGRPSSRPSASSGRRTPRSGVTRRTSPADFLPPCGMPPSGEQAGDLRPILLPNHAHGPDDHRGEHERGEDQGENLR